MIVFPVLVSFTPWPTSLYDVIVDVADGHVNVSDRAVELTALHPPGICGAEIAILYIDLMVHNIQLYWY